MSAPGKPVTILATLGDPNGIGPEITLKAYHRMTSSSSMRLQLVGSGKVVADTARRCGLPAPPLEVLIEPSYHPREPLQPGRLQAESGRLAYQCLRTAHDLITSGRADGLVTAPWNKEALHLAGCPQVGHTEALAALTGATDPITLFVTGPLRIAFLTRHLALSAAVAAVTRQRIELFVRRLVVELGRIGIAKPRVAVAALNPHAGEGGLLGREEIEEIEPAVRTLQAEGLNVTGPVPADAVFHAAIEGQFDCVVALYHDQGHIAAKTRDFFGTVSLTLRLPYVRTSPDHGTAFDIAGRGEADPRSMILAIEVAADHCRR